MISKLRAIGAWYKRTKFHRVVAALWRIKFELVPKWMVPVIVIAIAIPGPQDEILVFLLVAGWVLCHKELRRKAIKVIREA